MCSFARPALPAVSWFLALGVLAVAAPAAFAQSEAPPNLAVADLEVIFIQSSSGKALQTKLQELQEEARTDLETKMQQGRQLDQDLLGKTADEQREIRRKQEDLERQIRRLQEGAQRQAATLERESREAFNQAVQPIFKQLQEERGYDLILNKTPGVVIYAGDSVEITQDILSLLQSVE